MEPLPRIFYERDTVEVARDLLGKPFKRTIGDRIIYGLISETEAYRCDDEACHAYRGLTKRTVPLFGNVGHTYVYLSYGIHFCLNIVARNRETTAAGGVLIRAIIKQSSDQKTQNLICGPGRSTKALSITTHHNGIDVTQGDSELIIGFAPRVPDSLVQITPRIGISKGIDKPWRFYYQSGR
jgi:DNA-3-methyladenine glycosylase